MTAQRPEGRPADPVPPRLRRLVLAAALIALAWPAATAIRAWFSMRPQQVLEADYTRYVASSLIGLRFGWNRLYDLGAQNAVMETLGLRFWPPNPYTPALSLLLVPFTRLGLDHGFALWSAIQLASVIVCWHLLAPGDAPLRAVLLAMIFVPYPVKLGLAEGQVVPLQMALVAVSWALLRRGRDLAAGALLCALVLKPQGLQLIPFALLCAGRRRAFAGFVGGAAAIGLVVLAIIGFDGARAYADRLAWTRAHADELWVAWSYTLARHFETGWGQGAALGVAVAASLFAAFRHRGRPEIAYAAGFVGSLLASPYLHVYDLMLLFPAGWLLLRVSPARWAAPPILTCYVVLLFSTERGYGARWVLLAECVCVVVLALLPAAWLRRPDATAGGAGAAAVTPAT